MRRKFSELSRCLFGQKIEIKEFKPEGKCPYVEIRKATTIVKFLEENLKYSLCCKKSSIITVPMELYTSSPSCISSFIRGLYETDGSFYSSFVEISSMSKELLVGLRYLLFLLGINSRLKPKRIFISGRACLKQFNTAIKPECKIPRISTFGLTNIDTMSIDKEGVTAILKTFGIPHDELGTKYLHLLVRGHGSRELVVKFYRTLSSIVRDRITFAIDAIGAFSHVDSYTFDPAEIFGILRSCDIRKQVDFIRYDRLKEYYDGKRTPYLACYIKILRKLNWMGKVSDRHYREIITCLSLRKKFLG